MALPRNQPPTDPQLDQSSPYFTHLSDGPSSVSVSPKFNGANYHFWARLMRRALEGKMKLEFIDGIIDPIIDSFDPIIDSLGPY